MNIHESYVTKVAFSWIRTMATLRKTKISWNILCHFLLKSQRLFMFDYIITLEVFIFLVLHSWKFFYGGKILRKKTKQNKNGKIDNHIFLQVAFQFFLSPFSFCEEFFLYFPFPCVLTTAICFWHRVVTPWLPKPREFLQEFWLWTR